jgi:hypothetical protein
MQFSTTRRSLKHHGPDKINDTLLAILPRNGGMPFKDVAEAVIVKAYPERPTYQSEEKLRLRIYENLQELVKQGQVVKIGEGAGKVYLRV